MLTLTDQSLRDKVSRTVQRLLDEDFTYRDIARALGCSDESVGNWRNRNRTPGSLMLARLAELIGEPVSYFFEETKMPDPNIEYDTPNDAIRAAQDIVAARRAKRGGPAAIDYTTAAPGLYPGGAVIPTFSDVDAELDDWTHYPRWIGE